jgi:hypothetical protein
LKFDHYVNRPDSTFHSDPIPESKMASDLDKVQQDLDGLSLQDKLHVFDIHTKHNLHPPQDPLPRLGEEVKTFLEDNGEVSSLYLPFHYSS